RIEPAAAVEPQIENQPLELLRIERGERRLDLVGRAIAEAAARRETLTADPDVADFRMAFEVETPGIIGVARVAEHRIDANLRPLQREIERLRLPSSFER